MRYLLMLSLLCSSNAHALKIFVHEKHSILECTVTLSEGSFFGYVHPKVQDTVTLYLNKLDQLKDIRFSRGGYIPLENPLKAEYFQDYDGKKLESVRFVSKSTQHKHDRKSLRKVTLDFQNAAGHGFGPDYFLLWITEENPLITSVLRGGCLPSDASKSKKTVTPDLSTGIGTK